MNNHPETLILLRGLSREQRHWGSFTGLLHKHFTDKQLICFDLPGNGQRNHLQSPATIAGIVEFIRDELSAVLSQGPVHLVALSLGGMVAMEWMDKHPQEIASAALLSCSFKGVSPFYQRLRPANYLNLLNVIFSSNDYASEKTILKMTSQGHQQNKALLEQWVSYARQNPVSRQNVLRQLLAATRYQLPRVKPDVPVYLLNGLQDKLVSPQCSVDLAERWHLPLDSCQLCGHDLSLDNEQWVFKRLCKWFDGL